MYRNRNPSCRTLKNRPLISGNTPHVHSRKLTWKPKKGPTNTTVPLKSGYMGFHVSLGERKYFFLQAIRSVGLLEIEDLGVQSSVQKFAGAVGFK